MVNDEIDFLRAAKEMHNKMMARENEWLKSLLYSGEKPPEGEFVQDSYPSLSPSFWGHGLRPLRYRPGSIIPFGPPWPWEGK